MTLSFVSERRPAGRSDGGRGTLSREHTVGDDGVGSLDALLVQRLGGELEGDAGVDHVIDDQHGAVLNVAHERDHVLDLGVLELIFLFVRRSFGIT